ncbi:hypothetical protein V1517DRAFT_315751 [Lipomyces orientalis]|uniref:Uncharacterized protein n=1 Tax=Lipomyces orientalis TaxID=1233043 RepID=A0ACC3TVM5_9ASCO
MAAAPEIVTVELPEEETENFGFMALGKDALLTLESPIENPTSSSNLLSIANGRGLYAVAVTGGFVVGSTSSLRQKFSDQDKTLRGLVHYIPEPLKFLSFTSDEQHLVVVGQAGGMAWYFVDDLRQEGAKPRGFFRKGPLLDMKPNPTNGKSIAVLAGNRIVYLIDLPSGSSTRISDGGNAASFDWASTGQQIIVGNTEGVLTEYTVAGETVGHVDPAPDVQDKFVIFVSWIEQHRFLVIYSKPPAPKVHDYELFVITREPSKFTYSKIFDSCPPFGLTFREGWWYSIVIRNWNRDKLPYLILLASTPSIDIALMTEKHTFYLLDDTKRASLPFHQDKDTSPVGMGLDLTATDRVLNPKPGVDDAPALPILWVLNNVGQLKAWNVVWGDGVAQNLADVKVLREQHMRIVESAAAAQSLVTPPGSPPKAAVTVPEPVDTSTVREAAPEAESEGTEDRDIDTTAEEPGYEVIEKPQEAPDAIPESAREPEAQPETTRPEAEAVEPSEEVPSEPTLARDGGGEEHERIEESKELPVRTSEPEVETEEAAPEPKEPAREPTPVSAAEPEGEKEKATELDAPPATSDKKEQEVAAKQPSMSPTAHAFQLPSQLAGSNGGFSIPSFGQRSAPESTSPASAPATSTPSLFSQYANVPSLMQAGKGVSASVPFAGFGQTPGFGFGAGLGQQAGIPALGRPPLTSSPSPFGGTTAAFGQSGLPGPSPFGAFANRPAVSFGQSSFGQPAAPPVQPQAAVKPPGFPVPPSPTSMASPFGQFADQQPAGVSPFGQFADKQQAGPAPSSPFGQFANQQQAPSFTQPVSQASQPVAAPSPGAAFGARLGPTRAVPDEENESDYEDVSGEEEYEEDGEESYGEEYSEEGDEYGEEYDEEGDEGEEEYDEEYESDADNEGGVTDMLAQTKVDDNERPAQGRALSSGSLRADAKEFKLSPVSTSPSKAPGSVTMEPTSSSKSLRVDAAEFVFKPVLPATSLMTATATPAQAFAFPKQPHAVQIKPPPTDEMSTSKKDETKSIPSPPKPTEEAKPKSVLSPATAAPFVPVSMATATNAVQGAAVPREEPKATIPVAEYKKPDGLFSVAAPAKDEQPAGLLLSTAETFAVAKEPTDKAEPAGAGPKAESPSPPLIDVESKPVTPAPQKPSETGPEQETMNEAIKQTAQTAEEHEEEKAQSEDYEEVSEDTESSLLNIDEAPVNLKFSHMPPPVPEYVQISSVEEYQSKEKGLAMIFDRVYHETSRELDIIRKNLSRLSKFLEAHNAQHLIRHSREDFNKSEEWRLGEVSNMTSMIDDLMREVRSIRTDTERDEVGLHKVETAILKLDSKLTTAGAVLKQRSDPKHVSRLRSRPLPPDALELQREIRQKTQDVSRRLDELERENTLIKSKLSASAKAPGSDMFGAAPSIEGVHQSIQRITRFAQRRALDVSNLQNELRFMLDENSNMAASPRTPRTPVTLSGTPLKKGTPGSIVLAATPARSDKDFVDSPPTLSVDEEAVDELIARKKVKRKLRELMLARPETAIFTNEK